MTHISGRSAFLHILRDEGVKYLFGNPGTTELPIMDALVEYPEIGYVLGLQESVVMGMADGYSRASGQLCAVNIHVAPGLGNALGALYTAKIYGSPVIVSAGQQPQGFGLTEPLLYHPLVPMAAPLVKWAVEVTRTQDLPLVVRRAAKVALTPPAGPVFISLPGDVLNDSAEMELGAPTRVEAATRPDEAIVQRLAERLLAAKNPLIITGHEVNLTGAFAELAEVAELLGAPVYHQSVPHTAQFPSAHPLYMGVLSRDQKRMRGILEPCDLLFAVGADLFTLSVTSPVDPMPPGLPVIQLGQRDWEMGKNYPAEMAVMGEVRSSLTALAGRLKATRSPAQAEAAEKRAAAMAKNNWSAGRDALAKKTEAQASQKPIRAEFLMMSLAAEIPEDGVIVDEGITSTGTLLNFLSVKEPQRYYGLASGGLGFGMAGAVGVQLALPDRPLVCVVGDGSAMYTIQSLWTAAHLKLPITFVIANNRSYRILKDRLALYQGAAVAHEKFIGMDLTDPPIDFAGLAGSMGVAARRISDPAELREALREAIAGNSGPKLLDVEIYDGYSG